MPEYNKQTKLCRYCQSTIPKKAKVCPSCRKKQTSLIMRFCKMFCVFCFAVLLLVYCSNVNESHEQNDKDKNPVKVGENENGNTESSTTNNRFNLGDIVETENFRISYISSGQYVPDEEYLKPEDGYMYWRFEFKFENISDSDQTVSRMMDWECYADNVKVDQTWIGDDNGLDAILSPGRTAQGTVIFKVPTSATSIELEYDINFWESDKVVFVGMN